MTRWLFPILLAALLLAAAPASAQVFQYVAEVKTDKATTQAFLWIPPDSKQIRGVLLAGMTVMEREFVKHPAIRQACAEQSIAIVFLRTAGLKAVDIQSTLDTLAKSSGYAELAVAPVGFVGHSAGGPQALDRAGEFGDRTWALIQYAGGGPFNGKPIGPGVPTLMVVGQFDEYGGTMRNEAGREQWERVVGSLSGHRADNEGRLSTLIVEPGAGHFGFSDRQAKMIALWITKAAAARIPATWDPAAGTPKLNIVDPKSGWVGELKVNTPANPHAPYANFAGDAKRANWFFDKQLADAVAAFHLGMNKTDQFLKWNNPYWVDAGTRYFFNDIKWVGDGQTFEVNPAYSANIPATMPSAPRWHNPGSPATNSGKPIKVRVVSGPIEVAGDNRLRFRHGPLEPASEIGRVTFLAYVDADDTFRYTEHVGMLPRGFNGLNGGKDQRITFPPVAEIKPGQSIELKATSDSGLKVEYYVASGPGKITDGKLTVAELPTRAGAIEIKVVAYQFGSATAPTFKRATPVEQVVKVIR